MKRFATILLALFVGFVLDSAVVTSVDVAEVSSAFESGYNSELSADVVAQIDCARTYNSDLKLPSVPSVTAPQNFEQSLRNDYGGERR
jgi:hypothetical protein